jgi:ABC-type sugar transport system ATPase subunit
VDIAAKEAIHQRIRELAASGLAILVQSSELDELIALCSRVLVMVQGRLFATLDHREFSRERLLSAMMGHGS